MSPMARALLWIHIVYLLAIPLAGVASVGGLAGHAGTAYLGGWIVAAVYLAVQAKFYRLPRRPLSAALTVAIVPLQVVAHVVIWGGGFEEYFVEEAFLELSSLALALGMVMLAYRPSGWGGAALGVAMAGIAVYGFGWPLAQSYLDHGAGPEVWGLLALALATVAIVGIDIITATAISRRARTERHASSIGAPMDRFAIRFPRAFALRASLASSHRPIRHTRARRIDPFARSRTRRAPSSSSAARVARRSIERASDNPSPRPPPGASTSIHRDV